MIPKKIHYIWVGDTEIPPLFKKCVDSWQEKLPDYEIIKWNESNLDFKKFEFAQDAYDAGKFGFVPDPFRLWILKEHGGIYLDADVQVIKPFDDLLGLKAFTGCETRGMAAPGLILAAEKGTNMFDDIIEEYRTLKFDKERVKNNLTGPFVMTRYLIQKGLKASREIQTIDGLTVFPPEYFCPLTCGNKRPVLTSNTYSIHLYASSWVEKEAKSFLNKLVDVSKEIIKFMLGPKLTMEIKEWRSGKQRKEIFDIS